MCVSEALEVFKRQIPQHLPWLFEGSWVSFEVTHDFIYSHTLKWSNFRATIFLNWNFFILEQLNFWTRHVLKHYLSTSPRKIPKAQLFWSRGFSTILYMISCSSIAFNSYFDFRYLLLCIFLMMLTWISY